MISAKSGTVAVVHLAAAPIGSVLAIALHRLDLPRRKQYSREDEKDEYEDK